MLTDYEWTFGPYTNKQSDIDKDLDTTLIKSELKALILCFVSWRNFYIIRRLDNNISDEENPTSIARKLSIEECKSPIKSTNRVTDLDTQLSKEIDLFTWGGGRGEYLVQAAYSYLGTILSTSVDCEKCFSVPPTKFVQMAC